MGILDEAIREHLELKRQHGADDSELKQLEDDAFGPPERPGASDPSDTASEAATEFMQQPELGGDRAEAAAQAGVEVPQPPPAVRRESVADVQEAPRRAEEEPSDEEPAAEEPDEEPAAEEPDHGPADEEQPAEEHEAVTATPPPPSHTTAERHAIADQPTEMYDVEGDFAPAETSAPSDEDLAAEEETEPRLGPAEPIAEPDLEDDEEEDDDFFDEQRLSDELDQALEAPAEPDSEEYEPASEEDEQDVGDGEEEPERPAAREEEEDEDEDLLEDTPDFLEESPEDDELWFEQKPPKDFDFDD
jgi:hypothetical protein